MKKVFLIYITVLLLFSNNISNAQHSKLTWYGYFDMETEVSNKDAAGKIWTFDQHHFNIISIYQLDDRFRIYNEIEWEYGPSLKADEIRENIYLANAFLEYKHTDALRIRVGKFVSPFGIYNERHDATPTFIPTKLPHSVYGEHELSSTIKGRYFSKFSTGIQLRGSFYPGNWELRYQLYLSNGRGVKPSEQDDNANKGIGGRLLISPPNGNLRLGTSYYADKNGNVNNALQRALGFDLEFDYSHIHFESEVILSKIEKLDMTGNPNGIFEKGYGFYVLTAYTFFDKLTPFARYEFHDHDIKADNINENIIMVGINYSLSPNVYLKNEIHFHNFHINSSDSYEMIVASIAVAF
ncbi:MAG: porin [Candidatus Zixiibacteriota bacterium]